MSFGWHRAEVVGALVSVLLIWVVTGVLVSVAALRLATGDTEVQPGVMLITSGVSALMLVEQSTNKVSQCPEKNLLNTAHRCLKLLSTMMLVNVDETFESHTY